MTKLFICTVLIVALSLTACGKAETAKDGYTFTDALGRTVCIDGTPKRVAALLGSFAETWVLAGGELCAAAEDAWEDFGLEQKDAVSLGGAHSPSAEKLIAVAPDFVIASASTASNVELCGILENAGITVAYFDVDNFYDFLDMLKVCTDITGRKDLYEKHGTAQLKRIEAIKEKLGGKDDRVLLLRASSAAVKSKGSEGTVLGEMLFDLGCINVADNDKGILEGLSLESIVKSNPYRIFVVTMGNEKAAKSTFNALIEENPVWGTLDAVKNGRVHFMDKGLFNQKPNDDWAEAYEQLSEILQKQ